MIKNTFWMKVETLLVALSVLISFTSTPRVAARDIQTRRFSGKEASDIVCNADMRVGEIRQFCKLPEEGRSLMRAATSCCA